MTVEDNLKAYILERYKSIREFANAIDMSNSTIDSILRRGIGNSSVSNVIKICKYLNISVDELANGRIVPISNRNAKRIYIEENDNTDISEILQGFKKVLRNTDDLTLDGAPVNPESIDTIVQAIDIGEEMAKKKV